MPTYCGGISTLDLAATWLRLVWYKFIIDTCILWSDIKLDSVTAWLRLVWHKSMTDVEWYQIRLSYYIASSSLISIHYSAYLSWRDYKLDSATVWLRLVWYQSTTDAHLSWRDYKLDSATMWLRLVWYQAAIVAPWMSFFHTLTCMTLTAVTVRETVQQSWVPVAVASPNFGGHDVSGRLCTNLSHCGRLALTLLEMECQFLKIKSLSTLLEMDLGIEPPIFPRRSLPILIKLPHVM